METTRATADAPPAARPVPLETPVCAMFGLAHPVFAFSHSVPVAAAVSRCGGLGTYGATRRTPQEIR
ncbi:MAG: hypothetical protein O9972_10015, partial [Burkholderiales bacterium]|nr:hypothetical protein [Burkholderiales bacterium]